MRVDLHIHTTASDGTWTPEELIEKVKALNIKLFSVTDHDTVKNVAETQQLAQKNGLKFIPGVEVSSTLNGRYFHILGYGVDIKCSKLLNLLKYNTTLMEKTDEDSIQKLIDTGITLDIDDYKAYQHNPSRGGWKSLSYLIDKGICKNIEEFFSNLFIKEKGIEFPVFPQPQEVIDIIRTANGIPVLAHPGSQFHGTTLEETLDFFKGVYIEGIECFHPSHSHETIANALKWCKRHDMIITGGSDCHGNFVPERKLGIPYITLRDLSLKNIITAIF